MKKFEFDIKAGTCPGGTIKLTPGNPAYAYINMHIRAGYNEMLEASIDLSPNEARQLIRHLEGLIHIYEEPDGRPTQ